MCASRYPIPSLSVDLRVWGLPFLQVLPLYSYSRILAVMMVMMIMLMMMMRIPMMMLMMKMIVLMGVMLIVLTNMINMIDQHDWSILNKCGCCRATIQKRINRKYDYCASVKKKKKKRRKQVNISTKVFFQRTNEKKRIVVQQVLHYRWLQRRSKDKWHSNNLNWAKMVGEKQRDRCKFKNKPARQLITI